MNFNPNDLRPKKPEAEIEITVLHKVEHVNPTASLFEAFTWKGWNTMEEIADGLRLKPHQLIHVSTFGGVEELGELVAKHSDPIWVFVTGHQMSKVLYEMIGITINNNHRPGTKTVVNLVLGDCGVSSIQKEIVSEEHLVRILPVNTPEEFYEYIRPKQSVTYNNADVVMLPDVKKEDLNSRNNRYYFDSHGTEINFHLEVPYVDKHELINLIFTERGDWSVLKVPGMGSIDDGFTAHVINFALSHGLPMDKMTKDARYSSQATERIWAVLSTLADCIQHETFNEVIPPKPPTSQDWKWYVLPTDPTIALAVSKVKAAVRPMEIEKEQYVLNIAQPRKGRHVQIALP